MATSSKFDLSSGSPDRPLYTSGQRGSHMAASLERPGSFRESMENPILSSLPSMSRSTSAIAQGDVTTFLQCLRFDPKTVAAEHKSNRQGDLKRLMNVALSISPDDSPSSSVKGKLLPPPLPEDVKRVKVGLRESCVKARERVKTFHEALSVFNKVFPSVPSKKRSRTESFSNERSGVVLPGDRSMMGPSMGKIGIQNHAVAGGFELDQQKSEERTKNSVPNKRTRTSLVDVRMDVRNNTLVRPSGVVEREREMMRLASSGAVQGEERNLSIGVDGWEKSKMKKKRSGIKPDVSPMVTSKPIDGYRETKQGMQQRPVNDVRSRLNNDSHGFRPGVANGAVGVGKSDGITQPTGPAFRSSIPKTEPDNPSLINDKRDRPMGSDKERGNQRVVNKSNARDDFNSASPTSSTKMNASVRAPRSGSAVTPKLSPVVHRATVPNDWEISQCTNKPPAVVGPNNRKRMTSARSSSPPVAQWAGQRPQKMSRTARRSNFNPIVSSNEETPAIDSASDMTGSDIGQGFARRLPGSSPQQVKLKGEPLSSAALSESEESGAAEVKSRDKGKKSDEIDEKPGQNIQIQKVPGLVLPSRKQKSAAGEDLGDGVRRQGRTGRGFASTRSIVPMTVEKMGNVGTAKQLRSSRLGVDKSESKAGRPPTRRLSDRNLSTSSVEFKTPSSKANLFSGINKKLEFNAKREPARSRDTRMNKPSEKLRNSTPSQLWHGHGAVSNIGSPVNVEASEAYSPMDISPYQETLAGNQCSKENSASSESFSLVNDYLETDSVPKASNDSIDEDLAMATEFLNINKVDGMSRSPQGEAFEHRLGGSVNADATVDGYVSGAETESFKSATEEVDYISDTGNSAENEVSPSPKMERYDTDGRIHFDFHASSSNRSGLNFTFAASTAAQSQLSPSKRLHKKKNMVKIGQDANTCIPNAKVPYGSSSAEFSPYSGAPVLSTLVHHQEIPISLCNENNSGVQKENEIRQEAVSLSSETAAAQEACEKWRLRGNQAYSNGDLSKAEDCYTEGVNRVSENETSRSCLRALMLCYSNRAATRMSLGRIRDALGDCMMAAAIDPNFLKVQVRAANCYLTLGEVQDASQHFSRCLHLASDVCVDQKIAAEASDGLQKAQKVSECLNLCAELMQRKTSTNAERALELIAEALAISPSSEKLFEMKAEALFMTRRYEEVIELCERTLGSAEKNSPLVDTSISLDGSELSKTMYFRLWRCRLIFKSYFHLGKLEEGLASLEKEEEKVSTTYRNWRKTLESSIPVVLIVRELLSHKVAGNEAFQAGRHTEAVEHYTTALSCNADSRPFTAVCFCNRAAAYKALGQITDAIADCSLAIALDGSYLKAISRRATLYEMIRDYGQAAKDLNRLVSLLTKQLEENINQCGTFDISNSVKSDLKQARLRLSEVEEEARKDIPLDMYIILGIKPSISASEIKKAYRKAALRHHPDKAGQFFARSETGDDGLWKEIAEEAHKDADRLFKMIGEAYAVLSDSTKRARYDAEEQTRNAQKKRSGSSAARMPADAQNHPFERSGSSRQWRESWRSYGNSYSRGSEATWSDRYS